MGTTDSNTNAGSTQVTRGKSIRTGTFLARTSARRRARNLRSAAAASSAGPTGAPCLTAATSAATRGLPGSPRTGRRPSTASASDIPCSVRRTASTTAAEAGPFPLTAASARALPTGNPAPTPSRTSPASQGSSSTTASASARSSLRRRHQGTAHARAPTSTARNGWMNNNAIKSTTDLPRRLSSDWSSGRWSRDRRYRPRRSRGPTRSGLVLMATRAPASRWAGLRKRHASTRTTTIQPIAARLTGPPPSGATSTRGLRRRAADQRQRSTALTPNQRSQMIGTGS